MESVKQFFLNNLVWIILGLAIILLLVLVFSSRRRVVKIYDKYLNIRVHSNVNGAQFAQFLVRTLNLPISLAKTSDAHADCYVSKTKQLILSEKVCDTASVASLAIVSHEIGHALQDVNGSASFRFNHAMRKITNITNKFFFPLLIASLCFWIFKWPNYEAWLTTLIVAGCLFLFNLISKFSHIPIEKDATKKGLELLRKYAEMTNNEYRHAQKLLKVAGTTYIAYFFDDFFMFGGIKKYLYKTYS